MALSILAYATNTLWRLTLRLQLAEQVNNFVTGELTRLKARAMQLSPAGAELDSLIDLKRPAVEIIRSTPLYAVLCYALTLLGASLF